MSYEKWDCYDKEKYPNGVYVHLREKVKKNQKLHDKKNRRNENERNNV